MTFVYGPEHVCAAAVFLVWGLLTLAFWLHDAASKRRRRP